MNEKKQNRFSFEEMMLGFFVGLFFDILAAIIDFFSFGAGGAFIQGTVWPFIKKFWISSKNQKEADILKDYLLPIIVQTLPVIPTMCATIPVYMYIENNLDKSGIIKKGAEIAVGAATGGTGTVAMKAATLASKTGRVAGTINKIERGAPLSNSSKPRILSTPSSPLRTQNNPILKEDDEQEEFKNAA